MSNNDPSNSRPSVGASIVNFNAGHHLINCIESLHSEGIAEIVVVDNGSTDDSLDLLVQQFPNIPLIKLPNPGFGAGMNRGVGELKSDIVFCLNPDTVMKTGVIKRLLGTLESDPSLAMVGPRLENADGSLYPSARRFPPYIDAVGHAVFGMVKPDNRWSRRYKTLDLNYDTTRQVDWISGSAMFTRRSAFDSVGGFDESYFMYMEDVDLCWRLGRAGWKIAYEPDAHVVHIGGVSTKAVPYKMLMAHHRSLLRYTNKTATGKERLLIPLFAAGMALRLPLMWAHHFRNSRSKNVRP